jgi:hypothetical protein
VRADMTQIGALRPSECGVMVHNSPNNRKVVSESLGIRVEHFSTRENSKQY